MEINTSLILINFNLIVNLSTRSPSLRSDGSFLEIECFKVKIRK